jgi:hypothetical protein
MYAILKHNNFNNYPNHFKAFIHLIQNPIKIFKCQFENGLQCLKPGLPKNSKAKRS